MKDQKEDWKRHQESKMFKEELKLKEHSDRIMKERETRLEQ
jgi:hypothetical protein